MKYKSFLTTIIITLATQVQAQSTIDQLSTSNSDSYSAIVSELSATGRVADYTNKYKGYISSKVHFNSQAVVLTVLKKADVCQGIAACSKLETLDVHFAVQRMQSSDCYDSYVAKTVPDSAAAPEEKILIQRFASERCQSLVKPVDGLIYYKISGINSQTGKYGSAVVKGQLINLK